jgi:hypothetical protein
VIDTSNDHFASTNGDTFTLLRPLVNASREETLRAAAWLVAMADPLQRDFPEVLKAVLST